MFFVDNNQKANFVLPYSFPLSVNETYLKDKPLGYNDWHWHEELQFTIILEGEMIMVGNGEDHLVQAGDGIFINSNIAHMSKPVSPESCHYLSLNIPPSFITLFSGSVIEQKYFLPFANNPNFQIVVLPRDELGWNEAVLVKLKVLFETLKEQKFGYELDAYSYIFNILKTILENIPKDDSEKAIANERLEAHNILDFIHNHYQEQFTLEEVAKEVHLSVSETCRLFKSAYGHSIFTYLKEYRLQKSISLLLDSRRSISDICESVGFNSTSYYIKAFKEKVGTSPLKYRNNK